MPSSSTSSIFNKALGGSNYEKNYEPICLAPPKTETAVPFVIVDKDTLFVSDASLEETLYDVIIVLILFILVETRQNNKCIWSQ